MDESKKELMKVLFIFGVLPHYYNKVLNRLNEIDGLEISVAIPAAKSETVGEGVHQVKSGAGFELITLPEYKTYYGKPFFAGFNKLIAENNFDAVVIIWPYILGLLFYPKLRKLLKKKKTKLIFKDIPFQVPKFKEGLKLKKVEIWDETRVKIPLTFLKRISFISSIVMRKIMYSFIDAHVNYIEQAYDILGSYGVNKEKIFITYNSPDTDKLIEAREKVKELGAIKEYKKERIIHIGRLVNWKRVDLLLKAISILKNKFNNIELVIVGTGPEESNLKKLASDLRISENVDFVGGIYDPVTLGRYLETSSVYVLAGMGGLSINEAMSFEKPVICSVCDGTEKKLVRENYNGLYFKEGNADDLAAKIEYMLNSEKRIEEMGKNSKEIIENEVNIHTVINGYVKAFNYVSGNKFNLVYNRS